jgi:hypothetical protein
MATCDYMHGECDRVATTTLTRNDGVVVQLCEEHRDETIRLMKKLVEAMECDEADHWFVLNKIPA